MSASQQYWWCCCCLLLLLLAAVPVLCVKTVTAPQTSSSTTLTPSSWGNSSSLSSSVTETADEESHSSWQSATGSSAAVTTTISGKKSDNESLTSSKSGSTSSTRTRHSLSTTKTETRSLTQETTSLTLTSDAAGTTVSQSLSGVSWTSHLSHTPSSSTSRTFATQTNAITFSIGVTPTLFVTKSEATASTSITASYSPTVTASDGLSSLSKSVSKHDDDASTTHSGTAALASSSSSEAITSSQEPNGTSSVSYSWSVTVPFSATGNTDSKDVTHSVTPTITPPPTLTPTMSFSYGTLTDESTLTTSLTSTTSHSSSVTVSEDESHTVQSLSLSPPTHSSTTSDSSAPSTSSSPSLTGATFTNEHSDSRGSASMSLSQHLSFSQTVSPQPTQMSISLSTTITELLTLSIPPPTSTHIPTPTDTLLTSCPDCVHGTCTDIAPFICQCFLSYSLGFWAGGEVQGATCVDCVANFYGPSCKSSCPGGVCTPCNNHGICDDGVSGTGSCTCFANSTEGMWTGTSCDTCMSGYYGADCKGVCACVTNAGTCSDGISGDGSCTCASGRSGTQCESCTSGFYLLPSNSSSTNSSSSSSTCAECPGYSTTTGACFGNGECDPSSGICYCTGLYTQASNCEATDPDAVNGCNASCTQNNGTCLYDVCTCPTGSLGVNCEAQCPMTYTTTTTTVVTNNTNSTNGTTTNLTITITTTVVSSICGNHGSCFYDANTSTANCSCDANTTVGFYDVLTNCSTCLQGYGGDKCDTACPVHSTGGGICNYLNIAGGTIDSLCNSTSGECNCPLGYCGYDCTPSTRADGQCICNATTLFGPECNTTCVNGTTINWQNTSGRCICNTNFVGTSCDVECGCQSSTAGTCPYDNSTCVCVAGRAGSTCSLICPKNSVTGTTCSNHGYCQDGNTGNGQCVCTSAYVGEACQTPCQCVNSSLGSCQSDGKCVCDSSTWRTGDDCASCQSGRCGDNCRTQCVNGTTSGTECICEATFGGVGCDQQCPTSPTNNLLCSGNGNCSEGNLGTGKCVCVTGYVGPYCNCTDAGCVASRGANSVCNATTGTCSCVLPYGGSDCSTCATGYWGYSCMNVCPCVHGTCNRISGSCTCDADEQNGFWTGTLCNACVSGYNLPDCIQAVAVSTQIGSYQSIYLKGVLYYSAKKLLVLEEYDVAVAIGPVTAVYQNISQSIPTLMQQVNFASQIAFSSTACTYGYAWVAPQSPTTEEASSSGTTTTSTTTTTTTTTPSVYIAQLCALSSNNTYDTVVIQEYPLLPLSNFFSSAQLNASKRSNATFNVTVPQLEALVAMKYFTYQGSDYLAAAVTVIVSGNSVNALYSINFDASARVLTRQFASTPLASNLDATISTVDAVDYDPIRQRVIVVGTYDATGVSTATQDLAGVYVLTFPPNEAVLTVTRFLSQYTLCTYAELFVVNHTAEAYLSLNYSTTTSSLASTSVVVPTPAISVLLMLQVSNGTQDLIRINLTGSASVVSYPSKTTLASADSVVVAVYDPLSQMMWVVSNNAKTFKIIKLFLCSSNYIIQDGLGVEMLGSQLLPAITGADRRIVDVAASFVSRQLHLLLLNATGTSVRRYLLYDNVAIFPSTLSRLSSPIVTITGRGYVAATSSPFFVGNSPTCRITSGTVKYSVPAIVINRTTVLCTLAGSNTSLCSSDTVDIALFDTLFSTTQLAIPRFQQSQITSISPSTTTLSSSLSITSISVIGSGFVNSGILRCRFTAQSNATSSSSVDTVGTYVSSTLVYCSPPVFDDATRLYVNVACDGMIFTSIADSTLNLLAVVGTPYNITTSVTSISVTSAAVVALPTIVVSFIDDQSSPLQQTVTDRIEVVASFQGGLLVAQGALQLVNNVGVFTFSGMTLTSPLDETGTAVTFVATLLSGEATHWAARVPITVNSGSPNSLWLTNAPTVAAGIPESNRITVVEATVVDLAGNRVTSVTSSSNTTINATLSMQWELAPNIVFPDALYTVYPADEFQNLSEAMSSGIVTFSTFHVPNARGGYVMRFIVETNLTNSAGVRLANQTSQLVPKCNAGNIRFIGDTACASCPTNMVCPNVNSLATDYGNTSLLISVASGYARSTVYATTATACDPADACIGGTGAGACAAGYTGALCGLCEDSVYGRSIIGGNCVACNGSRVSGFLLFLVIVLICFTFILLTIGASQNWSVTMEPVVSIVLMVQHLHSVLGLGLTGFSFSQYFKDSMSYLGIFSTRVLDYYFSDCVLVDEGMTFYSKIAAYAAMPALALFLASISWLIVFISPEFLRFKGLRIERDKALQERREELIERLAKNQNQRRAVSTATSGGSSGGRRTFFLRETPMERLRRISDQAEVTSIEQELKNNLKVQGVLPLHDYRIFAAHSLQVVMLFTFHTIISYALSVFDCQDIDSGLGTVLSYLNEDFRVSCDSAEYQQFVGFGYAISILYFIFVPVMFLVLYAMHRRFRTPQVLQRRQVFYVMTIGLKTGSWYWTAVTLLRKGIQFAVAAVVSSPADAHVSVWLFVMQLIWLLKLKPYWNWSNTFLEAMSLSSCMIAGSLCILLESYTSDASQRAISAVILTVMLAPIPVFIFSATQKVWSSVREEIRALRFDSEEESSSCSDDEIETQHREVMAMIHTKKKNIAISNPSTKDNLTSGAPADVPVAVESHYQPHRPSLAQKKHALRNVSVAEYLRAEDESREAREEHEQQSRELQAANAALHQQQKGINAGQTFAEWRRHRQHQLLNSSKQPGSAASQQPNSIQQLAQPLRLTAGSAPVFLEINHSSSSSSSISEASNSLASSLDEAEIDNDETLLVLHPDNNADTRPLQHEQIRHLRSPAFPNGNSDDTVVVASEQNFEIARLSVNTRSIDHGEDARRVAAFRSAFALSHQRQRLGASSSLTDDIFDIL